MVAVGQVRLEGVRAEVWVHRHGIGAVAVERLAGVLVRGGADVAAFGVEDQQHIGVRVVDVVAQPFELWLGTLRGEVGELRLEGTDGVGRRVDDRLAELVRRVGPRRECIRQPSGVGVEPDAEHRS